MSNFSTKKIWKINDSGITKINAFNDTFKLKHGMFAGVPILCKKDKCPYKSTCYLSEKDREEGERCPIEISAIITRFDMWCKHFDIDSSTEYIKSSDLVDASLIKDLVDLEVQTLRAENRIAISGDFIGETVKSVDNKGNAYYEDTVSPEAEFKLSLMEKRYKVLQLLNSTRKDKDEGKRKENVSSEAISVFKSIENKLDKLKDIDLDKLN